jgi:hypothetical protein
MVHINGASGADRLPGPQVYHPADGVGIGVWSGCFHDLQVPEQIYRQHAQVHTAIIQCRGSHALPVNGHLVPVQAGSPQIDLTRGDDLHPGKACHRTHDGMVAETVYLFGCDDRCRVPGNVAVVLWPLPVRGALFAQNPITLVRLALKLDMLDQVLPMGPH